MHMRHSSVWGRNHAPQLSQPHRPPRWWKRRQKFSGIWRILWRRACTAAQHRLRRTASDKMSAGTDNLPAVAEQSVKPLGMRKNGNLQHAPPDFTSC